MRTSITIVKDSTFNHNLISTNPIIIKVFYTTNNTDNSNDETVKGEIVKGTDLDKGITKNIIRGSRPKFSFLGCFYIVKHLLEKGPIGQQTQKELERFLYEKSVDFSKENRHTFLNFPRELREKLLNIIPEWEKYITNLKITFEENKSINNKDFYKLSNIDKNRSVFFKIINSLETKNGNEKDKRKELKHNKIIAKMLLCLLTIIKYHDSEEPDKHNIKTTVVSATISLGKEVIRCSINELFQNKSKIKKLSLFKKDIIEKDKKNNILLEDNLFSFIGGKLIDVLINHGILENTIITKDKARHNYLKISSKTFLKHKNKT